MVQEAKKKTVHMEVTWRLELKSVGLHPCEASIQKQCEGCADTAGEIMTLTTTYWLPSSAPG